MPPYAAPSACQPDILTTPVPVAEYYCSRYADHHDDLQCTHHHLQDRYDRHIYTARWIHTQHSVLRSRC